MSLYSVNVHDEALLHQSQLGGKYVKSIRRIDVIIKLFARCRVCHPEGRFDFQHSENCSSSSGQVVRFLACAVISKLCYAGRRRIRLSLLYLGLKPLITAFSESGQSEEAKSHIRDMMEKCRYKGLEYAHERDRYRYKHN